MKGLKLSAVALAVGFSQTTWALECTPNAENSFSGQNNAVVENCQIQVGSRDNSYRAAVTVEGSSNLTFNHLNINVTGDSQTNEEIGLSADNSTFSINHSQLSVTGVDRSMPVKISNSTLSIGNSTISTDQADTGGSITANNSTLYVKDTTLRVTNSRTESLAEIVELDGNNSVVFENVTGINQSDDGSAFSSFANGTNHFTLNNSSITAEEGFGSWWDADGKQETLNSTIVLNNTTFKTTAFIAGVGSDEELLALENFNVSANNSHISGVISASADEAKQGNSHSTVNLTLNNSRWETQPVTEDGTTLSNYVSNLTLNNGVVALTKTDGFQTLTLGELSGSGTFELNTDLANQQSDQIIVNGEAQGSHKLDVKDSGNEPQAANGKVTLVKTQSGDATFSLLNRDYVDAGAYRYRLAKQGNDWLLSNNANEQSTKTPTTQPNTVTPTNSETTPTQPSTQPNNVVKPSNTVNTNTTDNPVVQRMLSETSNALVSLRQAQLLLTEIDLNHIHQRLGELRNGEKGNVWVRSQYLRQDVEGRAVASNSRSSGFTQDVSTLQIGVDSAISDSWKVGGFVGTSQSKLDLNGEYGKAKLKGVSAGLYATFQAQNGIYLDNIAKYERLRASADTLNTENYNSYSLSTEIGKAFQFADGWAVTPQAQLGWTHIASGENVESLSALTTRVGVRLSKSITLASGSITPFVEVNGINSHARHSQVKVNQYAFDVKNAGSRVEAAVGVSANLANHRLGVQLSTAKGSHIKQPVAVQVNYRYSW